MQDKWITDWEPSTRFPHYTRSNVGEISPDPSTPLGWTFAYEHAFAPGWAAAMVEAGSIAPEEVGEGHPQVLGHFGGRLYINLSASRMQAARSGGQLSVSDLDRALFGSHPDVPPYDPHPADNRPDLTDKMQAHTARLLSSRDLPGLAQARRIVDKLGANRPAFSSLSNQELVDYARSLLPSMRELYKLHVTASFAAAIPTGILGAVGDILDDPGVAMRTLGHLGDVESADHNMDLWELGQAVRSSPWLTAQFDQGTEGLLERLESSDNAESSRFSKKFSEFVRKFGFRGANEWELASDSWETNPKGVLDSLDSVRKQPDSSALDRRREESKQAQKAALEDVRRTLADQPELLAQFELGIDTGRFLSWREQTKSGGVKATNEARVVFKHLGMRAQDSGDLKDWRLIYMLKDSELDAFAADPSRFGDMLVERREEYDELFEIEAPFIIAHSSPPPLSQWKRVGSADSGQGANVAKVDALSGTPGSAGTVTGTARVLSDPYEADGFEPGDIIVAQVTDPAWTPLFMIAGGVVMNEGGQTSHAVIVSRELGIPCVVAVTDATSLIPDGATVELDGATGQITIG